MSIESVYIKKVEKELEKLKKDLSKVRSWELEIKVLKEKLNSYKSSGFSLTSRSSDVVTLDDILARDETRLNTLESNLDYINYRLNKYKASLNVLNDNEYEVINRRYLSVECKRNSYEKIAKDMHYSHMTIKRWHDSAIKKIAEYQYGSIEIA